MWSIVHFVNFLWYSIFIFCYLLKPKMICIWCILLFLPHHCFTPWMYDHVNNCLKYECRWMFNTSVSYHVMQQLFHIWFHLLCIFPCILLLNKQFESWVLSPGEKYNRTKTCLLWFLRSCLTCTSSTVTYLLSLDHSYHESVWHTV